MTRCLNHHLTRVKFITLSEVTLLDIISIDSVTDVTNGFNSTIFAYGQTGSGKTFTMFGPNWDDSNLYGRQQTMPDSLDYLY
jgi:hypothetical protein